MRAVLAKVKLTTGNVGWYDPLTNIHLTIQRPEALVYEGMNTSNLRKGVMYKTITVIDGSLEPSKAVTPTKIETVVEEPTVAPVKEAPVVVEEVKEVESAIEDIVEEKPKKKTTRKKKSE